MLENINNIGYYVKTMNSKLSIVDLMVNKIGEGSIEYILEMHITDQGIKTEIKDYNRKVSADALFYQAGNGFLGGGFRLDFDYENKIIRACRFCEIEDSYEAIKSKIAKHMEEEKNNKGFVLFRINGKTPRELFENKFIEKMYTTMYKKINETSKCHICGARSEGYNTAIYKFYTNDKEIYGNFVICRDCISNILVAKDYIENNLTSYWLGGNVMFLPSKYDENIAFIYETFNENGETTRLLKQLKDREEMVLDALGGIKSDTLTDIVFYEKEGEKSFNIYHQIQGVLPSRFRAIAENLIYYKLKSFYSILEYVAAVKTGVDKTETTDKERMRVIESIFKGRKINRNLFFKRAMDVYKMHCMNDKHQYTMLTINRIYNFLCKCGCLEKEWKVMQEYKNYIELFEDNTDYFDSNEKKAWFLLGKSYKDMIRELKKRETKKIQEEENLEKDRTSLEKNFFFSRRFSFEDFIWFSNLLADKAVKYSVDKWYIEDILSKSKAYMAKKEGKLSQDEAKYLFYWGMHSYFKFDNEGTEGGEK